MKKSTIALTTLALLLGACADKTADTTDTTDVAETTTAVVHLDRYHRRPAYFEASSISILFFTYRKAFRISEYANTGRRTTMTGMATIQNLYEWRSRRGRR